MTNVFDNFYTDQNGAKRKIGIFAPGIDRFILIDSNDIWITLQTAEILSSKLPTMVYILSKDSEEITNTNCHEYTILNKTQQKVGSSNIVSGRQNPCLRFLYGQEGLIHSGIPEDYKEEPNKGMLENLKQYASYVHKRSYALSFADSFYNFANTAHFINKNISDSWIENISIKYDLSKHSKGILFEVKNILYTANDLLEAEEQITDLWLSADNNQNYIMAGYYKMLNQNLPKSLEQKFSQVPDTLSTYLF